MTTTAMQVEVKERPILFSGPMVRAILEGRKTQTRRVITNERVKVFAPGFADDRDRILGLCPYGRVGDRLWVRETWQPYREHSAEQNAAISQSLARFERGEVKDVLAEVRSWPFPPNGERRVLYASDFGEWAYDVDSDLKPWKPSIFMPRWASRITLEITNVRVEKLQEISEADAIAEGLTPQACAAVFKQAAGKVEQSSCYWLEHEETGEEDSGDNRNYCRACAVKRQKKRGKKWMLCSDGGSAMESDGPAFCECGTPLLMSLSEYGVERELRIEDDPEGKEPEYFSVRGMDASMVEMIADGIGDLQEKHHGRLAQIGFATGWNHLNAKRGYSWESDPWVWVIEFRKL